MPMNSNVEAFQSQTNVPIPLGNENILLIDDEEIITDVAERALRRLGYHVIIAKDGADAVDVFNANRNDLDLIITDFSLPLLTGIEVAEKIISIKPDVPIILFTGYSEVINKEHMKRIGIKELMKKPVGLRQLGNCVRRVLDKSHKVDEVE